jgi:flagellar hook-associated protein 1 FlgK
MGLAALDSALSGLRISQQQISVIATNVANAGTPGYTRKILPQSVQAVNGTAVGVLPNILVRNVNLNLERDLWTQVSSVSSFSVQESYLTRIQQFHGPPDKELSIAASVSKLMDSFSALSDSPSDSFLQFSTVNEAVETAAKINNLSKLITTLRNDAQNEMNTAVTRINDLLDIIANVNADVAGNKNVNLTTANSEDIRDKAINELAGLIDISFFVRGDGVLVVQTNQGVELASERVPRKVYFSDSPLSSTTYYPDSAGGVYVGDPLTDGAAFDITSSELGGRLGGLIALRDEIFPKQMAQLDELAHKMALRFDAQGLRLFTDTTGNIPFDTAPNAFTLPDPTPVEYVGFSAIIQVNDAILDNNSLLQKGTYGGTIPSGSNEVIRRIVQNTFGDTNYQQAIGDIDLRVSTFAAPNNTLQAYLGIDSSNRVTGTRDLAAFNDPATFIAAANGDLAPGTDTFRIVFSDANLGLGPVNVDVSLGAVPNTGGNFAQDLIGYINGTVIPGLPALAQTALTSMNASFAVGANGQLVISSNATIALDATVVANGMGDDGLALLGFAEGSIAATDPYFDIKVGNNETKRITIDSNDTEIELMAKLAAVPGLAIEDITTSADGFLRIRPGNNYTNPDFGGDIRIIAGPYTATGAGANTVFGAGTIPNGINIASALFGSFTTGPLQDRSPITNVAYGSETDGSLMTPPTLPFRANLLGPGLNISTGIAGALRLTDYAQKMVNEQSQEASILQTRKADEQSLKDLLEKQLLSDSGVNVDEELSNLIVVQNAYAASARVVTVVSELFQELLNAIR